MVAALGYPADRIRVILHQFVTLSEGGETVRMSTRRGEFVTLDELVDDVGPDAVRYFMLARSPESHMDFDLELARKQSNENPVYYIQNAHVRCASMMRSRSAAYDGGRRCLLLTSPAELVDPQADRLPEIIETCVQELQPHRIAFWAHGAPSTSYDEVERCTAMPEDRRARRSSTPRTDRVPAHARPDGHVRPGADVAMVSTGVGLRTAPAPAYLCSSGRQTCTLTLRRNGPQI